MTPARKLTRQEMEERRLAALPDLFQLLSRPRDGGKLAFELAAKNGVSRTNFYRWARELKRGGPDALKRRKSTGRPSRLARLPRGEREQAEAYIAGHRTAGLSCLRGELLRRFGLTYTEDHLRRLRRRIESERSQVHA